MHRYAVTVWEEDRAYGGPEEGGWWFTTGDLILSVDVDDKAVAEGYADLLRLQYQSEGDLGSVLYRGGCYWVTVLDRLDDYDNEKYFIDNGTRVSQTYPVVYPHYE